MSKNGRDNKLSATIDITSNAFSKLTVDATGINVNKTKMCQNWIETSEFDSSDQSSIAESSSLYSSSISTSDFCPSTTHEIVFGSQINNKNNIIVSDWHKMNIQHNDNSVNKIGTNKSSNHVDILQHVFQNDNNIQTFGNVNIENSNAVHIGNITYVTGPIHIIQTDGGNIGTIYQSDPTIRKNNGSETEKEDQLHESNNRNEQTLINENYDPYIRETLNSSYKSILNIVNRRTWLAHPPTKPPILQDKPVPHVIICHTASKNAINQSDMIYLVRNIQTYHTESQKFSDISYNFLVGGDGNIYEGRGWGKVGDHTLGYNTSSIGIAIVGCYMNIVPEPISLTACKLLIDEGVKLGHIAKDYKLLAHCQCKPTLSPGKILYEEIKTWPHWTESIDTIN